MTVLIDPNDPRRVHEQETRFLSLTEGGQQGELPVPHQWVSAAAYARQKVRCVLVQAPGAMQYMPNANECIASLKCLVELLPQTIEGLNAGQTWGYAQNPVGNSGGQMDTPISAVIERTVPAFTWYERYGKAIHNFWKAYGNLLIMDPHLSYPGISAVQAFIDASSPEMLPNMRSFTCLFFEPDETMTRITDAWLVCNMMPQTAGENIAKREMAGASEVPSISITFTGLEMQGQAVIDLAATYLKSLKVADARPFDLKPFYDKVQDEVTSAKQGLAASLSESVNPKK